MFQIFKTYHLLLPLFAPAIELFPVPRFEIRSGVNWNIYKMKQLAPKLMATSRTTRVETSNPFDSLLNRTKCTSQL